MKKILLTAIFCGFLSTFIGCNPAPTTKPATPTTGSSAAPVKPAK